MSDKVKIIFYNFFNIGDTYFSQSFVKNIIDNNGENFEYYIWCNFNDYIFTNLFPSITNIRDNEGLKQHILLYNNHAYPKDGLNYCFIKELNTILINTWIGCTLHEHCFCKKQFLKFYKYDINECNVVSYIRTNAITINRILKETQINIIYNTSVYSNKSLALPIFSSNVNINEFLDFKKCNQNKKIIFLNNYFGNSQQPLPIKCSGDYIRIIDFFIKKNYIVFLSQYDNEVGAYKNNNLIKDLYFTHSKFNVGVDVSCYNVYYCAKVAHNCDLAIYFDTGKNFTYLNYDFLQEYSSGENTNKKIHFGITYHYFKSLSNPEYFPSGYVEFIQTNNCDNIISYLDQNIV